MGVVATGRAAVPGAAPGAAPGTTLRRKRGRPAGSLRIGAETWLGLAVVAALGLLILAPLGAVLLQAFIPGAFSGTGRSDGLSALLEIFERPLWQRSLTNSLTLAGITALLGGAIGVGLAMMRHGRRFPGAGLLDLSAWMILILPSFIVAQGWMLFATRGGIANQWLGLPWVYDLVFNPWGLALVMSLKTFPYAYLTTSAALHWRVDDYAHAARLCGAGPVRVLATVRVPMLLPAILSGMLLIFIDTIGDFGLPAALATTYRFPTLPYTIYVAINQSPIRFDLAGVLALYLTLILLAAVLLYFRVLRRARYDFLNARARAAEPPASRRPWLPACVTVAFLAVALGIPVGTSLFVSLVERVGAGLSWENLTLAHYALMLAEGSRFRTALANSLAIAGVAAACSAVLAFAAAYLLTFSGFRLNRLIDLTCTLTLAVPGVVLGIGYIFVWNAPLVDRLGLSLYGHPSILVLAAIAGAVPIAVRIILGSLAQVPRSFLAAAALQGAGLGRRILTIVVPLAIAAVVSATLTAFGSAVFDLAITSILHPPRLAVLPVYVNRTFEQGYFGESTAAVLVAGGVTVAVIAAASAVARRVFGRMMAARPAGAGL